MSDPCQYVYFILAGGNTRRVKIGTGFCPEHRLQKIRLISPVPLRIVARIPCAGSMPVENALHLAFNHARVRGEWFDLTDGLRDLILAVRRGDDVMPAVFAMAAMNAPRRAYHRAVFAELSKEAA